MSKKLAKNKTKTIKAKQVANILDKIISDKRIEVEKQKIITPLESLKDKIKNSPPAKNFYEAVTKINPKSINVIAEIKKASPSAGLIRKNFNPKDIAKIYQDCGACAISVLTDEKYFKGKLEYIEIVKKAVNLPILRKDFMIDSWQIYQAKAAGADAVLLIADALSDTLIGEMTTIANELDLTVLLEIHNEKLLPKVLKLAHDKNLIGVNNRNLSTMVVDINNVVKIAKSIKNKKQLVAESGIKTRADVEKIIEANITSCLIGQTLCEHKNIQEKYIELFG